jgi:hypothetical protein
MGLWFTLDISTKLDAVAAGRLLAERLPLQRIDETHLVTEGMSISIVDETRDRAVEIYEDVFHFTPTLGVGFKISTVYGDLAEDKRLMIRATMLLLERGEDAVLLFNEQTVLQRLLGGKLVLNERAMNWDALEDEVFLPHERRHIPSYMMS